MDRDPVPVDPLPDVLRPREHVGIGRRDPGAKEVPGATGVRVRLLGAEVAAEQSPGAGVAGGRQEPGDRGVVKSDDVAGPQPPSELGAPGLDRPLVQLALVRAKPAAVAGASVEVVVEAAPQSTRVA